MLRSTINQVVNDAALCFKKNGWVLPPSPRWDITDFGLADFQSFGLVLVNLCEEPEYCEKLMYATKNQKTPAHCHKKKKEDIICRFGILALEFWQELPEISRNSFSINKNGIPVSITCGDTIVLNAGERVTIPPLIFHQFYPLSSECIIGEVSTGNDDFNDNFFANQDIGRFPAIMEDERIEVKLIGDL